MQLRTSSVHCVNATALFHSFASCPTFVMFPCEQVQAICFIDCQSSTLGKKKTAVLQRLLFSYVGWIWILPLLDRAENFAVAHNIAELRDIDPWKTRVILSGPVQFHVSRWGSQYSWAATQDYPLLSCLVSFVLDLLSMLHTFTF